MKNHTFGFVLAVFMFFVLSVDVFGEMSSTNYSIPGDDMGTGGSVSTSTNYQLVDNMAGVGVGDSTSSSYTLNAGFLEADSSTISIDSPLDVELSSFGGVTGGSSSDSVAWTVTTNNSGGYTLSLSASTSPALQCVSGGCSVGVDHFDNYTVQSPGVADYAWNIDPSVSEFGFTVSGTHIVSKYKDSGATCGSGSDNANTCYYYFSTSDENIAHSSSSNSPSGTATSVTVKAQSGSGNLQPEGTYSATITATALMN